MDRASRQILRICVDKEVKEHKHQRNPVAAVEMVHRVRLAIKSKVRRGTAVPNRVQSILQKQ